MDYYARPLCRSGGTKDIIIIYNSELVHGCEAQLYCVLFTGSKIT